MHLIGIVILIAAIIVAVWIAHGTGPAHTSNTWPHIEWGSPRSPALDLLEQRYARGEISREEYLAKKRDLTK